MTRDRRLLLLLILLMAYGLFAAEARHRRRENTANDARHRHRHRHESWIGKKNRHELANGRSSWPRELDYVDDYSNEDREARQDTDENEEEEEDDYEARIYYKRSPRLGVHGRTFAPRYPVGYHYRRGYRGTGWHEDDDERRRGSSRYGWRNYELRYDRTNRRLGYSRNRESDYVSEEEELELETELEPEPDTETETETSRGYDDNLASERRHASWRNGRKRNERHEHQTDGGKARRADHSEGSRKIDDRRRKWNTSESKLAFDNDERERENSNDYEYHAEGMNDEEEDDDEGEEEASKETDDELDNDFYKSEKKPLLKTYDDIIKRLTSDDPTTLRPTVKREYRNIEAHDYAKRLAFGNFRYDSRNLSRPLTVREKIAAGSRYANPGKKTVDDPSSKLPNAFTERKFPTTSVDRREKKPRPKIEDARAKTKSLEQDYDEYLNTSDNEKEEDLVEAGIEEDSGMQADVTNTDYAEHEEEEEEEETTFTASTSTSTTTTTTTSTTTPRPVVNKNYDYRDSRTYESNTGSRYNGYQSKHDYPAMSAHSIHKWQSLGTRESVKETRSNMQRYNKNGKTSEIREALQHAMKVSREGSCQWPRPRVIPVRDVYPSPSTTYIPHCAILHRCSDDTGCCRLEALTCVPKHSHRVELSFYTTNVGGSSVVEKLSFYNHTECECRERTEYDATNEKPSEQRVYRHYQTSPQPQNMRRAQPRKPCRCPSEFTPRITPEGECQCNCYETHQNCIKIRRGKGYFSLADRLCIQNEECAAPSCEFGEYMRRQGKCPRKKDKYDAIVNYHTNLSHRYRS
ncbi:uncharacterized protein LOC143345445 [Colletes latitarsis]|uniref:uncharacterized protein LOC143345445 n=1 Tax=Colletes latitarsis TaxID=2605962 RepID=UPI004036A6E5